MVSFYEVTWRYRDDESVSHEVTTMVAALSEEQALKEVYEENEDKSPTLVSVFDLSEAWTPSEG